MTDARLLIRLKYGLWNQWREGAILHGAPLREADLLGAILTDVRISQNG